MIFLRKKTNFTLFYALFAGITQGLFCSEKSTSSNVSNIKIPNLLQKKDAREYARIPVYDPDGTLMYYKKATKHHQEKKLTCDYNGNLPSARSDKVDKYVKKVQMSQAQKLALISVRWGSMINNGCIDPEIYLHIGEMSIVEKIALMGK